MGVNESSEAKPNCARMCWALILIAVGVVSILLCLFLWRDAMFYVDGAGHTWHGWRYAWCCSWGFLGFGSLAYYYRDQRSSPHKSYANLFLPEVFAGAALIFGGLHLFASTSGFVFYYLAASVSFSMGFLVENYNRYIAESLAKLLPKPPSKQEQ